MAAIMGIVDFYPFILGTIIQAHFISDVHKIYLRFKLINRYENAYTIPTFRLTFSFSTSTFEHILAENNNPAGTVQIINTNKMAENMPSKTTTTTPRKVNDDQNPQHNTKTPIKSAATSMPTNLHLKMHLLFEQHDQLLEISEWLNCVYALQIVTFVTVAFVKVLFGFFFETKVIFWLWGQNTRLTLLAVSYLLWSVLMLAIIYLLLSVCTLTRNEAYRSAMIVHKILQKKPIFVSNNEIYYNKLKAFTLKILHRKTSFKFNGFGLFVLDFTFIFSVAML